MAIDTFPIEPPVETTISVGKNLTINSKNVQNLDEIMSDKLSTVNLNTLKQPSKSNSIGLTIDSKVTNVEDFKSNLPEIKKSMELKPDFTKCAGLKFLSLQREKLSCRKGGNFSIMLAGSRGTGKTTFLNSLFGSELLPLENDTIGNISMNRFELKEEKFILNLQVIETIDFGNNLNNEDAWNPICKFIDDQFLKYLQQSQQPYRKFLIDTRIHVCLYFLNPGKCCLSDLDIETMKRLSTRVNLIPVVSKSDILTPGELENYKTILKEVLFENDIKLCSNFTDVQLTKFIDNMIPFSIVGSIDEYKNETGKLVRGRKYTWGLVEIENPKHCDFAILRNLLLTEHMLEFILSTEIYYENFRSTYLTNKIESVLSETTTLGLTQLKGFDQLKAYTNVKTLEKVTTIEVDEMAFLASCKQKEQKLLDKYDAKYSKVEEQIKSKKEELRKIQQELRLDLQQTHFKKKKLLEFIELNNDSRNNLSGDSSVLAHSDAPSIQSSVNIEGEIN